MKLTKSQLKQIIKEEMETIEEVVTIGSHGDPMEHLHKIIWTDHYRNVNTLAGYLVSKEFTANFKDDREGFHKILQELVPQLQEFSQELTSTKKQYATALQKSTEKWNEILERINNALSQDFEDARTTGMSPKQQIRDRMRKAHANRESDPAEYEAAQKAYEEFRAASRR